jgi:hypothetical protein
MMSEIGGVLVAWGYLQGRREQGVFKPGFMCILEREASTKYRGLACAAAAVLVL